MYKIHKNFTGGNIRVKEQSGNIIYLENELRDTEGDWFYWAFCVEDAQEQELTFHFQENRLGYYGPAVSHDLKHWEWMGDTEENSFTYRFAKGEQKVYFAHDMLYHPDRFEEFAARKGLKLLTLCTSLKGRQTPYFEFGDGEQRIILTARHHACEATGSYVLEGVLEELLENPIENSRIFCVPFVDYDGVIDGDQGKNRRPHDQNRDYHPSAAAIYPETGKIREYAYQNGVDYAFDFHSPWHKGGVRSDHVYIVRNSLENVEKFETFGKLLEQNVTDKSMKYNREYDYPPMTGWNIPGAQFGANMWKRPGCKLVISLETPYFGGENNQVSQERLLELGRCFARTFKKYRIKG